MGYLGGVSWAILVASVCQHCPNLGVAGIISQFFIIYHELYCNWHHDEIEPIRLNVLNTDNYDSNTDNYDSNSSLATIEWDPNDARARYSLMPILTPARPVINCSHNVVTATFNTLV